MASYIVSILTLTLNHLLIISLSHTKPVTEFVLYLTVIKYIYRTIIIFYPWEPGQPVNSSLSLPVSSLLCNKLLINCFLSQFESIQSFRKLRIKLNKKGLEKRVSSTYLFIRR